MPLEKLGPYKLEKVLGRGGMGAVYAGLNTQTGERAAVKNFSVAGKTGTAWISAAGGYSNRYTAVFGGMVPASDPRLVAVIVIDDPQGEQFNGGDIAAPVFARIATGALRLMAVPPDSPEVPPLTVVAKADL